MAASILTQDLIAICLILSKGDTQAKLEEIIRVVENYQESSDRHFGITRQDFRNLWHWFICFVLAVDKEPDEVELWKIIPDILRFSNAYFNHEGEELVGFDDSLDPDESEIHAAEYWYGYPEEMYRNRILVKQNMKAFFSNSQILTSQRVMEFLLRQGIDKHLMYHCSRPGKSS